ncbi:tRNA-dihydrouridine synthase family protein [Rhodocyclus tenuis]|uniref:tRNA-dihydrouridine(16) synthase n=1 Tax=Rhodocyclus gracilis TaxID=2929842 RepID=A0ABX0WJ62_9RHOO|nr:tRNA-dihydrouridine synthase family protein [Rhodocyclus gracilis]NJA89757.1 tRNA-dihydrouridine synthase family protein [Rhodocyclus gracilis]
MSADPSARRPGRVLLAPMDGVADVVLRAVLTRLGGFDLAVTEFVRVTSSLLPPRTFLRTAPELEHASCTPSGTPVRVQLLGGDASCLAENAARLAELGPAGIDLNFGCPAPTVNRHDGGAVLLNDPERLFRIADTVRRAMPAAVPLSAKMRLGVEAPTRALECAQALAAGGIDALVVHARTRDEGYRPPAHWALLAPIGAALSIPVVANGEVWSVEDYHRCRAASGLADVMIGRGAVSDPFLARRIGEARLSSDASEPLSPPVAERLRAAEWQRLLPSLAEFWAGVQTRVQARAAPGRLKQWLKALSVRYDEAGALLAVLRPVTSVAATADVLRAHGVPVRPVADSPFAAAS